MHDKFEIVLNSAVSMSDKLLDGDFDFFEDASRETDRFPVDRGASAAAQRLVGEIREGIIRADFSRLFAAKWFFFGFLLHRPLPDLSKHTKLFCGILPVRCRNCKRT